MLGLKAVDPFEDAVHGNYARNQIVTDPEEVDRLLASSRRHHFHKLNLPDPAPPVAVAPATGPAPKSQAARS